MVIKLKDSNGTIIATTTTDDKGEYGFVGVPVGEYVIIEEDPAAYSSVKDEQSSDDDTTQNSNRNDNEIPVTLSKDEKDKNNDFVDEAIGHIAGNVVDENGDGIKGVTIKLKDSKGNVVATTTTNDDGLYVFANMPVGEYVIVEEDPAGYSTVRDEQSSDDDTTPNSNTNDNEIPITLTPGEIDKDNIFVDHTPAQKGTIKGGVGDVDSNEPIKDVKIILKDSNGNVVTTTTTDENGAYEFKDIPAGEYVIVEEDPVGYSSEGDKREDDNDNVPNSNTNDNMIPVTLTDGEVDKGNDFGDRAPAKKGDIKGSVKDSVNNPLEAVTVKLKDSNGDVVATTTTKPDGTYEFKNIPVGEYVIVEEDPIGYKSVSDSQSSDNDTTANTNTNDNEIPVTLTNGEVDADNNFVDSASGQILGKVTDDNSKGIKNVTIKLKDSNGDVVATTTTDSEGKYYFNNIPLGDYIIVEEDPTGYSSLEDNQSADNDNVPNTNTNDNEIPVSLKFAGEIDKDNNFKDKAPSNVGEAKGSVKDENGIPVKDVTIELRDLQGNVIDSTTTNDNGEYEFKDIPAGDYVIVEKDPINYESVKDEQSSDGDNFSNDDTNDNEIPLTITSGEVDKDNNFTDKKIVPKDDRKNGIAGKPVVIDVLANDEGNLDPSSVKLIDKDGNEVDSVTIPGQGTWSVEPDGKVKFTPEPNFVGNPDKVRYSVRSTKGYKVLAYAAASYETKIKGYYWFDENENGIQDEPSSRGVVGVVVKLYDMQGNLLQTTKTDNTGHYEFDHVMTGQKYKIKFSRPDGYIFTQKDAGADSKDCDVNELGVIETGVVNDEKVYDIGVVCDGCAIDKANTKKLSASAFNFVSVIFSILTFGFLSRRRK